MQPSALVSELRAEVSHWWEDMQKTTAKSLVPASNNIMSPLLGSMLGEGPLRMMCLGQELTIDQDERTLSDLHMTDGQVRCY